MTDENVDETTAVDADNQEIPLSTALKLLLFLVWWFSGIGVGTAFMSPGVVGSGLSPELLMVIILANFCSMLLITAFIPGPDDTLDEGATTD